MAYAYKAVALLGYSASRDTRERLIRQFLCEEPGTGSGRMASRYAYEVERMSCGATIVLKRPAALNKGMDFTVHVSGCRFRNRGMVDAPSHADVIKDLVEKKQKNPNAYGGIAKILRELFNGADPNCNIWPANWVPAGLAIEQICLATKWLFIEQDVTYWNWSGRAMLYGALQERNLV